MKIILYFIKLSKKQWVFLGLGLLLSIITALASLGLLSIAGYLICGAALAGIFGGASTFNYFLPAAGVRFFAMVRIASRYGDRVLTHDATFRLLKDLRIWFYEKLEPQAPAIFLRHRMGDLLSRMISDINAIDKLYLRLFVPFFSSFILILCVSLFIGFFSIRLSWILLVLFFIAVTVVPKITYEMGKHPAIQSVLKISSLRIKSLELSAHLLELILFNKVNSQISTINQINNELVNIQKKQANIRGVTNSLILIFTNLALVAVLLIGIPLVYRNNLLPANLGLLVLLVFAVFETIFALPHACQYISETVFAGKRILEIAEGKPLVSFKEENIQLDHYDLQFQKISFQYTKESRMIFENFSLEIAQGEHCVIVAETGKGKSTLAYLATRYFDPIEGSIILGGINLKSFSESQIRDTICYISQDSHMFNSTLRENLIIAKANAADDELSIVLALVKLAEFSSKLDTMMGEFGKQFSGGQVRRIALARALLKNAPITILDEPFEGVDNETAHQIWKTLQKFFHKKTLIVITHQIQQVPREFRKILL